MIPAVLILIVSVPLVLGIVPRNRVYGIRTCKTLSDDSIWYPANRFGGWALIVSCVIYLSIEVFLPYNAAAPNNFTVWSIHFWGFIIPLTAGIVLTLLYCRWL